MDKKSAGIFDRCAAIAGNAYNRVEAGASVLSENRKANTIVWAMVVLLFFSVMLLLNFLTPLTTDDFGYTQVFDESRPVGSIADIIRSQYNHYMLWGGRSVVHFIAQALLILPPIVLDLLNSLVYILFTFLIYYHIKGRGKSSLSLFVLINIAIWIFQPAFGETMLWAVGSCNYLWGTTLILLYLLPFRVYDGGRKVSLPKQLLVAVLFFIYAFFAGWTNENTAAAMLLIVLLFAFYFRSQKWNIPIWVYTGFAGALIGYLVMIAAPGNALRAGDAGELSLFIVTYRFIMHTITLFVDNGALLVLFVAFLSMFWYYPAVAEEKKKDVVRLSLIYFAAFVGGIYIMIFSPSFPSRAWFGVLTFCLIAIGILFYNLDYSISFIRRMRFGFILVGVGAFVSLTYLGVKDTYAYYKVFNAREAVIREAKSEGLARCVFDRHHARTKFVHSEGEQANFLLWNYYGIEIRYTDQEYPGSKEN